MKSNLLLIPCTLGLILSGCAVAYDPYTGQTTLNPAFVVSPGPVVVEAEVPDAPYYVYGDVPYYFVDGRYFYFRGGHRFFVGELPHGGHFNHNYAREHANFVHNRAGAMQRNERIGNRPGMQRNEKIGGQPSAQRANAAQGKAAPQKGKAQEKKEKQN